MTQPAAVIVGAGPTGLMLAGELALAGVEVVVVERNVEPDLVRGRAGGLHARTIELLDQRGIADRFLAAGTVMQVAGYAMRPLDISDFPTRHNYGLALWQQHTERILAAWVQALAVPVYRGREVAGFAQDATGVDVALVDGGTLRAQYLVGCDGGHSGIRKAAGIAFPGWDPTTSCLIGEAEMTAAPPLGMRTDASGTHALSPAEGGRIRLLVTEPTIRSGEPTLAELSAALVAVYGSDFGVHRVEWLSRFTDTTRQAAAYRERRVLLAGDAAHVHPPHGGQGLNLGVHDAMNLGWKLAQVIRGTSPERLLDTYQAERHPVAARILRHTMAQVALRRLVDDRSQALFEVVGELLAMDEPRRRFAGMMSGLDIHYDLGAGHPLLGRRMPDLELVTDEGTRRTYSLLHRGRGVLLDFGEDGRRADVTPWAERVQVLRAHTDDAWTLPVVGDVAPPAGVLVRPDGHVAWVGDVRDASVVDALTTWFGPAVSADA